MSKIKHLVPIGCFGVIAKQKKKSSFSKLFLIIRTGLDNLSRVESLFRTFDSDDSYGDDYHRTKAQDELLQVPPKDWVPGDFEKFKKQRKQVLKFILEVTRDSDKLGAGARALSRFNDNNLR